MSGFSAGIATFCSCNKAGSILQFNSHLKSYPNDYDALLWRGRAYMIIEEQDNARSDFIKAMGVSDGPKKSLAEAYVESVDGNSVKHVQILESTTKNYPKFAPAWHTLGLHHMRAKTYDTALSMFKQAVDLGKENRETKAPWYAWCNYNIGEIYQEHSNTVEAKKYFNAAVESCDRLTVGYLGLCNSYILENNYTGADRYFCKAKELNSELVPHANFAAYRENFKRQRNERGESSAARGGGGQGISGSGHGSGGGDGSNDGNDKWKKFLKNCEKKKGDDGNDYYQVKGSKIYYCRDTAGHAGSILKKFEKKDGKLELVGSVDRNMRDMPGKHESGAKKKIKIKLN